MDSIRRFAGRYAQSPVFVGVVNRWPCRRATERRAIFVPFEADPAVRDPR